MPNATLNRPDAELDPAERLAQDEFNRTPGTAGGGGTSARDRENGAATGAATVDSAAKSERTGAGAAANTMANAATNAALSAAGPWGRALAFLRKHKKGTGIGAVAVIIIAILVYLFVFFAPAGIFLHLKEMGTRWMTKYQEIGVGRRASKLMKQIYFGDKNGCTDNKWRCRHNQGVTDKELEKLKNAGFDVKTETRGSPQKTFVTSMSFEDPFTKKQKTIDGGNFESSFRTDPGFRSRYGKVMTPLSFNLRSKSVVSKLVGKLGVNRRGVTGEEKDREGVIKKIRQHLYSRGNADAGRANIDESQYNQEGKPRLNVDQLEGVGAELVSSAEALSKEAVESGVPPGSLPDPSGLLNGDSETLTKLGNTVASGVKGGAKGALLGALAGVDAYCSLYQVIRTLTLAMKVYAAAQLMQYASLFLVGGDQLKANAITLVGASVLAGILLRQSTKPESKGKTVSDSLAVTLINEGKVPNQEAIQRFTVGGGMRQALDRLAGFLNMGQVSPSVCKAVGSPIGQIGLIMGGIISSILTGGVGGVAFGAAVGAAKGVAMGLVAQFATPYLIQVLAGTVAPDPEKDPEGGFGAGNALVAGLAGLGAEVGKSSGMKFLTNEEVAAIEASTKDEQRTIAAVREIEAKEAGVLNWENPMSFTNRMAMALTPFLSTLTQNPNLMALAGQGAGLVSNGLGAVPSLLTSSAYAQEAVDPYRGDLCHDEANKKLNLATTAVCGNIAGPDGELLTDDPKWNPGAVDKWMIDNRYVNGDTGAHNDELKEFKEICMDSVDVPVTEDGSGIDVADKGSGICLSKEVKYRYFRIFLGYENDDQSRKDAAEDKLGIGASSSGGGGGGTNISGDAKSLAQQILEHKNIEFNNISFEGAAARASFEATAKGEPAKVEHIGTTTPMSTSMMRALLQAAQSYKFRIGYTTNGDHGSSSRHYTGRAVDLNAINGIELSDIRNNNQAGNIAREFSEHIAKFLPQGGGIGEKQCMGSINLPSGINYFEDTCNHLHIDVGNNAP
ncbi:MAG TPA: hypothetical protein VD907_05870 [Verrucomicrobiae bacterium]|nr:hypothetical protein [Verrucomicrobiae bacterium]